MARAHLEEEKQWIASYALALSSEMGMLIEVGWIGGEFGVDEQMHVLYDMLWHPTSVHVGMFESTPKGRAKLRERILAELRRIRNEEQGGRL